MKERKMSYQYFLLDEDTPVSVTFNDKGRIIGAEIPSCEAGRLVYNHGFLVKVYNNDVSNFDEVTEITEEEFNQKVKERLSSPINELSELGKNDLEYLQNSGFHVGCWFGHVSSPFCKG